MNPPALALSLAIDERGLLPDQAARVNLVAEVRALAAGIERERPPLSLVFAIDASGSMAGPPIEQVILSIDRLLRLLEPTDRVGVIAFSDGASQISPLLPVDGEARKLISSRVHRLKTGGATHMESGIAIAAAQFPPRVEHERQVILLLTDGVPNKGKASPDELAAMATALRPDLAISTLGYGPHHNEDLLKKISEAGAGRYHFIADPVVCEFEFAQAIGAQGDVVAEAIELSLLPEEGVEIARFLGKPQIRFGAAGLLVGLPDLLEGARHPTVAELSLRPKREPGLWRVLTAKLSYRRAGARDAENFTAELLVPVGFGERGPVFEVRSSVLRARADEVRAEARALADRGQFEGAAAVVRRLIEAIQAEPGFTANDGSPLAEALEQLVDEAVALERKPSQEQYQSFRRSQLGVEMARSAPCGPESAPMSRRVLDGVAGALPRARLVVIGGDKPGEVFRLDAPRMVIGRTQAAHIQLHDANISRQQSVIMGQQGRFLITDLGSTNTTVVNGQALRKPWELRPGDVVKVGDLELRYEEEA